MYARGQGGSTKCDNNVNIACFVTSKINVCKGATRWGSKNEIKRDLFYGWPFACFASYLDKNFIFTNVQFLPYPTFSQFLIAILPAAGEG